MYQLEQSKETVWPYYCFNVYTTTPLLQNISYFLFHLYIPNKWIYYLMNLTPDFQIIKVKHAEGYNNDSHLTPPLPHLLPPY